MVLKPLYLSIVGAVMIALLLSTAQVATGPVFSQVVPSPPPAPATSLALNGTSAYAEAPHAAELNIIGSWTLELWRDENGSFAHPRQRLLTKGDLLAVSDVPYWLSIGDGGVQVGIKAAGSINSASASLAALDPLRWHHVAATLNASTRQLTIYLDGAQASQATVPAISAVGNTAPVAFGRTSAANSQYFRGKQDDLRIWNVLRTPAEIQANYQAELSAPQPGLVGNWRFDEGAGPIAADAGGATAENASLFGSAGWSTDVPHGPPAPTSTPTRTATATNNATTTLTPSATRTAGPTTDTPTATATTTVTQTPVPTPGQLPSATPTPLVPATEGLTTVRFTGPITGKSIVFNVYLPAGYNTSP